MKGGKRENSGRKRKEETTTISFRISKVLKTELQSEYSNLNKLFIKFVEFLKNNKDEQC